MRLKKTALITFATAALLCMVCGPAPVAVDDDGGSSSEVVAFTGRAVYPGDVPAENARGECDVKVFAPRFPNQKAVPILDFRHFFVRL